MPGVRRRIHLDARIGQSLLGSLPGADQVLDGAGRREDESEAADAGGSDGRDRADRSHCWVAAMSAGILIVRQGGGGYQLTKQAVSSERVGFDWSRRLLPGDRIDSSSWDVPAWLDSGGEAVFGARTSIRIAGGVNGGRYTIANTIVTSGGATHTAVIRLLLDDEAPLLTPLNHSIPSAVMTIPVGDDLIELQVVSRPYTGGPVQLAQAQSGQLSSNPDATGEIEFRLPPGFTGGFFAFGQSEEPITITPDAADSIGLRAAGASYRHDMPGSIVSVRWSVSAGQWRLYHGLMSPEIPDANEEQEEG
jgi:hypothetical protein